MGLPVVPEGSAGTRGSGIVPETRGVLPDGVASGGAVVDGGTSGGPMREAGAVGSAAAGRPGVCAGHRPKVPIPAINASGKTVCWRTCF